MPTTERNVLTLDTGSGKRASVSSRIIAPKPPKLIPDNEAYCVFDNEQIAVGSTIIADGILIVDGLIVEV